MSPLVLEVVLAILLGAVAIDFIFGEPRSYLHPVTVIRKFTLLFEPYARRIKNKRAAGMLLTIFVAAVFGILTYLVLVISSDFIVAYVVIVVILLKGTFSITSIGEQIHPVVNALEEERIEEARAFASRIIRRDTTGLDSSGISSAVIESISVSLLNDVFAPLFYFSIFGVVGAFVSRVVNVLDTLYGQKNRKNIDFGKWPAILHSVFNYVPAKIVSFFIMLGSELLNYRVNSISFIAARTSTDSTNNGWAMGAMASSLNLRLEKSGYYIINDGGFEPSVGDIKRALRTYYMAFYVFLIIYLLPMLIIVYYILVPI